MHLKYGERRVNFMHKLDYDSVNERYKKMKSTGTYLFLLACPSVKSVVACHKVCFLGCGLVSRKKAGCRASWTKKR